MLLAAICLDMETPQKVWLLTTDLHMVTQSER